MEEMEETVVMVSVEEMEETVAMVLVEETEKLAPLDLEEAMVGEEVAEKVLLEE